MATSFMLMRFVPNAMVSLGTREDIERKAIGRNPANLSPSLVEMQPCRGWSVRLCGHLPGTRQRGCDLRIAAHPHPWSQTDRSLGRHRMEPVHGGCA